jgi:ankyrin repeat protein
METFAASLEVCERRAEALWAALRAGDDEARWRFNGEHPRFRGRSVREVDPATRTLDDARLVVARSAMLESWAELRAFTEAVTSDGPVRRFELAVEDLVNGNLPGLRHALRENPGLVRARSSRRHHATLLHYVAANGVEGERQRTPPNAVEVAELLLRAGAQPDALADMYENRCTTLSMLLSSSPPADAGLQAALAATLLDHGAALVGPGSRWRSSLLTALAFGFGETARTLARRGAAVTDLPTAAGLGRLEDVERLLPTASAEDRHAALALAAQHGHAPVVRLLLDAGVDPSRFNPDGFHAHSTPLHQAVWAGHAEVVALLAERGARLDLRDTVYDATPLGWAEHGKRAEIAEYLRGRARLGSSRP